LRFDGCFDKGKGRSKMIGILLAAMLGQAYCPTCPGGVSYGGAGGFSSYSGFSSFQQSSFQQYSSPAINGWSGPRYVDSYYYVPNEVFFSGRAQVFQFRHPQIIQMDAGGRLFHVRPFRTEVTFWP
jgi:hypothetical protein